MSDTQSAPVQPPFLPLSALVDELTAEAERLHEARRAGQPLGPTTGLPALDKAIGECLAPGVHILHAGPGAGKTAFCLQAAASCGCPAVFLTCELSRLEIMRRHTARVTGEYLGRLKTGELRPERVAELARKAAEAAPMLAILDGTSIPVNPAVIEEKAALLRERFQHPHCLIVVDSLHTWCDAVGGNASEYERLNAAVGALRGVAARLSCPVVTVAERSRAAMQAGGLSASAGSRKAEYGSETVLELSAADEARFDSNGEKPVTLRCSKNRHGQLFTVELLFSGRSQKFREAP